MSEDKLIFKEYHPTPLPESGQFIAVWEFDDELWSAAFRVTTGGLETYNSKDDVWERTSKFFTHYPFKILVIEGS